MKKTLPELETKRLRLTSFNADDAEAVFAYASDPNVARYTSWLPHRSVANYASWIEFVTGRQNVEPGHLDCPWAIHKKESGAVIGCIAFKQTSESHGRIDYVLTESEWKRSLMTEAATAVLNWVFDRNPEIQEIESSGLTENTASCALLRKCGMARRKTERHRFQKFGGAEKEVSYFSITRDEMARQEADVQTG